MKTKEQDKGAVLCHKVERFENLMYKGCEPHWHCKRCDDYWPLHCYGKDELEKMPCPARMKGRRGRR